MQVKRGGTAKSFYREGYPNCKLGVPVHRERRHLSRTNDLVEHALVERRFLEARETLDGIIDLAMVDHAECPEGYHMVDRDASLSGNLQQGSYTDTPSFLCVKFGSAAEYEEFTKILKFQLNTRSGFATLTYAAVSSNMETCGGGWSMD